MRKIWEECSHAPLGRVWDLLTCWLIKGVLKRCFLESGLTRSFTVYNFRNKVAMKIIFFFTVFKTWSRFQKWKNEIRKKLSVLEIIAFELGTTDSQNLEQDSCHSQLMWNETPLRFNISLTDIFAKSSSVRGMKKYDESTLI